MQVYPTGPCPAKIMLVGDFPGEQDVNRGEMFTGYAGEELNKMLQEAGIFRGQCFITSAIRVRPPRNDVTTFIPEKKSEIGPHHILLRDRMVVPAVVEGLELLKREIEMCRPNVIVAFGNAALWALTGEWGITSWRGSEMQTDLDLALDYKPKVIPVYSPTSIFRQWSWRPIAVHDLKRVKRESESRELIQRDYSFLIRPDYGQVHSTLTQLLRAVEAGPVKLAVDVETRWGSIDCVGIAWSAQEAICIPLTQLEGPVNYWESVEEEANIVHLLHRVLQHKNAEVVGQNFSYDAQYFQRYLLCTPRLVRDTMLAQHSMFSNLPKDLAFLASMYCEHYTYWKDEINGGDEVRWRYNCKDCCLTWEIDAGQQAAVDALGLRKVHDFQQALFWPVLQTMTRGLRVDTSRRAGFAMELMEEMAQREQFFIDVLGRPLNPKSPKQMQELFYVEFGQKPVLDRKTGNPSTNEEALRKVAEREPLLRPLVNRITEYRSLGVFLSTFVNAPLDIDGRMRCSFNIGGTETYRFSSSTNAFGSGLNLQNIPKGGGGDGLELPNIRSLFLPDPGMTFFDIDLSSADLRIVVWESDESEMKAMLAAGLDPYTEVAKEFYKDPSITKKDPRRQLFKAFCHGTHYLGTAKGLAERLGLSVKEAEKTQKWYFERFPRIKKWQDDLKDQIFKRHMVQNVFGYRYHIFDRIEGTLMNQVAAWIPQSTVGILINRAYMNIYNNLKEVQVLLQVHDSLAGQFPTHLGDWAIKRILEEASIPLPYDDPLIIPVGCKTSTKSWGDCED